MTLLGIYMYMYKCTSQYIYREIQVSRCKVTGKCTLITIPLESVKRTKKMWKQLANSAISFTQATCEMVAGGTAATHCYHKYHMNTDNKNVWIIHVYI